MNLEMFAEWLRRQGHTSIIKSRNGFWYDQGPHVYQAFPYHGLFDPSPAELRDFFNKTKAIALRYSTSLNSFQGQISYHVVYDQPYYELVDLPKKARHDVSHGLQYASYQSISFACLVSEGWILRKDTLVRQGREKAETKESWDRLCLSAEGIPGFEAWGAFHENQLVAALLAFTIEDTVSILYQQSMTQHLKFGVNNALTYTFTREVLNRPGNRHIFYGLHSLDAPPSVDEFKFRMGYTAKPVRQRVLFNPSLAPLFNKVSYKLLCYIIKIWFGNPNIMKLEGLFRFYMQGKLPLSEQDWPEIILPQRDSILAQNQ